MPDPVTSNCLRGAFRSVVNSEIARRESRPDLATGHDTGCPGPVKKLDPDKKRADRKSRDASRRDL